MLDPITILGVASSVAGLLDTGAQLVGTAYEIYQSTSGALEKNIHLADVADDLTKVCKRLEDGLRADSTAWTPSEKEMQSMARKCVSISRSLVDTLNKLKQTTSEFPTWNALRQAVKQMRKKGEIEEMRKRLEEMRSQLAICMLQCLLSQQSSFHTAIYQLTNATTELHLEASANYAELRNDLVSTVESIDEARRRGEHVILKELTKQIERISEAAESTVKALLKSLYFKELPMRYIQIPEAYEQTNQWLFNENDSHFRSWLTSSSGIFWISGKAGSGKSTLMKFLADNHETRRLLLTWAKIPPECEGAEIKERLAVASYYFWKSGYPMQKTLIGLYRCLLYHIFKQYVHQLQVLCQKR